ncbi:MAG: asparagine synthase (glutamine-hydrolyzing) [Acidobacteria bacterium]|nr:asparagine synthase (glutamine-hydrolyzing) [Acidobacteriota bacterium]|tara:strand:- start:805 stop:2697 length:1893 start_codon:yes stop_codon:yes gene_type:complete
MCGIAGIVERDPARPVDHGDLISMVESLRHRGPDDHGEVVQPGFGLGMRRLSIIDIECGQQPFSNEDGTIHLVANGEIYNHALLRQELAAKGHRFRSCSDVEVILHGYESFGVEVLSRLRGMFAFALWDGRRRRLFAARDRAGEKPLFFSQTPNRLFFASEIKALLKRSEVSRELDFEALDQFLTYEYVLTPRTIFSEIRAVPPAHYLVYERGAVKVERYWDVASVSVKTWSEQEAAAELRASLARAVSGQMMSDVPLGAFLSGGIDSSAIVGLMSEATAGTGPVNTFSMGFEAASYNELPYAREVASQFGTSHREGLVNPDLAVLFEDLVSQFDQPFADVSLFPTYLVSKMAREHVTVVLSGDGGDELFGGYDTYQAEALARRISSVVPESAIQFVAAMTAMLPPSEKKKGFLNKLRRFTQGFVSGPQSICHYRWMTFLDASAKQRIYTQNLQARLIESDVYAPIRRHLRGAHTDDLLNRQLYADLQVYLNDDILVKVDRVSMANSLETRAPFLDTDVMELAFSMPGSLKIRNGQRKYVLRRAMKDLLPQSVLGRAKEGFSIPMKTWLRREWAPLMQDLLCTDLMKKRGWFVPGEVSRLVGEHLAGHQNHAHLLFALMVLERWCEVHVD